MFLLKKILPAPTARAVVTEIDGDALFELNCNNLEGTLMIRFTSSSYIPPTRVLGVWNVKINEVNRGYLRTDKGSWQSTMNEKLKKFNGVVFHSDPDQEMYLMKHMPDLDIVLVASDATAERTQECLQLFVELGARSVSVLKDLEGFLSKYPLFRTASRSNNDFEFMFGHNWVQDMRADRTYGTPQPLINNFLYVSGHPDVRAVHELGITHVLACNGHADWKPTAKDGTALPFKSLKLTDLEPITKVLDEAFSFLDDARKAAEKADFEAQKQLQRELQLKIFNLASAATATSASGTDDEPSSPMPPLPPGDKLRGRLSALRMGGWSRNNSTSASSSSSSSSTEARTPSPDKRNNKTHHKQLSTSLTPPTMHRTMPGNHSASEADDLDSPSPTTALPMLTAAEVANNQNREGRARSVSSGARDRSGSLNSNLSVDSGIAPTSSTPSGKSMSRGRAFLASLFSKRDKSFKQKGTASANHARNASTAALPSTSIGSSSESTTSSSLPTPESIIPPVPLSPLVNTATLTATVSAPSVIDTPSLLAATPPAFSHLTEVDSPPTPTTPNTPSVAVSTTAVNATTNTLASVESTSTDDSSESNEPVLKVMLTPPTATTTIAGTSLTISSADTDLTLIPSQPSPSRSTNSSSSTTALSSSSASVMGSVSSLASSGSSSSSSSTTPNPTIVVSVGGMSVSNVDEKHDAKPTNFDSRQNSGNTFPSGVRFLVHCSAGMNRSVSIAVAYAVARCGYTLKQAYEDLWLNRPIIHPFAQNVDCLVELERKCSGIVTLPFKHFEYSLFRQYLILKDAIREMEEVRASAASGGGEPNLNALNLSRRRDFDKPMYFQNHSLLSSPSTGSPAALSAEDRKQRRAQRAEETSREKGLMREFYQDMNDF